MEAPQTTISTYLIKQDRATPESCMGNKKHVKHKLVTIKNGVKCDLYVRSMSPRSPKWAKFLDPHVDIDFLGKNQATGAVLFVPAAKRLFAVTFGQAGRFIMDQNCWEERYGLLVVLNSIEQDQIKTIDKSRFDALTTHSRVQTSKEASPQDFGVDIEQDLVRAVTGTLSDKSLGQRLTGMDALKSSVRLTLDSLPELLSQHLKQYKSTSYRKTFPWVDHIAEIRDSSLQKLLDDRVVSRIRSEEFDKCWFAVPDLIDWSAVDGFKYGNKQRNAKYYDLHLVDFVDELKETVGDTYDSRVITIEFMKRRNVLCIGDDEQVIHKWPLYSCLYCEVEYRGTTFLLSGGKWYRIDKDFVEEVNSYFKNLRRFDGEFPEYDDTSESAYNTRVCSQQADLYALMDQKLINIAGFGAGIEFCDLYTRNKDIVHVKRYGQSKVFSHFFSQGTVSAELFHTQTVFRRSVNRQLPPSHQLSDVQKLPEREEYRVVFAIVSDHTGKDLTIPFFSRINLRAAANRLRAYGFRVAIGKVNVVEARRKIKRYQSKN